MEFGQYLRELRKSKQLKMRELARQSGISQPYLSQIETGKRKVSPDILMKLSKALNVGFGELFEVAWDIKLNHNNIKIEKRIKRAKEKVKVLKESHGDNPGQTHTYHGGWDLGYWEGRLATLEDIQDEIEGETK
jgi:transcriptional regulator with XRE-family HTH domain